MASWVSAPEPCSACEAMLIDLHCDGAWDVYPSDEFSLLCFETFEFAECRVAAAAAAAGPLTPEASECGRA